MKIIALEEHPISKAIETANHDAITVSFPYYATFNHPVPSYHLSLPAARGGRNFKKILLEALDVGIVSSFGKSVKLLR